MTAAQRNEGLAGFRPGILPVWIVAVMVASLLGVWTAMAVYALAG